MQRRTRTQLPTDDNRVAPAQIDQSAAAANLRYALAGRIAVKGSLVQHTSIPENDTLVETPQQQVADSVQADLFSWDPLEGIESALTRQNIKSFNDIRMKGELFAPMMPINYVNTLGPINPIPSLEGMDEVKKSVMRVVNTAQSAAGLYITDDYKCTSEVVPEKCPFGFPGRRQTPFIPINTLSPDIKPDVSLNGLPVDWYDEDKMRDDDDQLRFPLQPSVKTTSYQTKQVQLDTMNTAGLSWQF
jgi:hypothetical protein